MTRTLDLDSLTLDKGSHAPDHTFCVMEAVAYVAGEAWSDQPQCVDPVLTAYCIRLNDHWNDEQRQALKPYIARLVGTKGDLHLSRKRAFMAADAAVRIFAPLALDARGLPERAAKLRAVPAIVDRASALAAAAAANAAANAAAYAAALQLLDRMIEATA